MRTGFCRHCRREFHSDIDYFGYCGIGCIADFAHEQKITYYEAKHLNSHEDERNELEDRIASLEYEYEDTCSECSSLYESIEESEGKIKDLKIEVKTLKNLDWEKVKRDRRAESAYNESVLRKMKNIKDDNDDIKERMSKTQRDNILLHDQNMDLLNSIKELKGHSERFQQMDLGIELEYDE